MRAGNALQAALDEYDARRRPDVHALAHLNLIAPQARRASAAEHLVTTAALPERLERGN